MRRLLKTVLVLLGLTVLGGGLAAGAVLYAFWHFGRDLPDFQQLAVYEPPVMTRIHAGDGRLLAEYATEKRVFVPIRAMPRQVINAVLSAEDKNFYTHQGVDFLSLVRAVLTNVKNYGSGRRPVGASTLTQQVAKNFLLTNEVSIERKAKEAILAFRIERAFTKERILELYLNEVYLGAGSYGVAAAALNYFNKSLDELTIAEAAYLAALLKAPANYHPVHKKAAALERRNWVIGRLAEDGHITPEQAALALQEPLEVHNRADAEFVNADYFAEEVRRDLAQRYGETQLYTGGLNVHATLEPRLQVIAKRVLRNGLVSYDRRHGWRGPITHLTADAVATTTVAPTVIDAVINAVTGAAAEPTVAPSGAPSLTQQLERLAPPAGMETWRLAVVTGLEKEQAQVTVQGVGPGLIPLREMKWARQWAKEEKLGPAVQAPAEVLKVGDVVAVETVAEYTTGSGKEAKTSAYPQNTYALRQIPAIQGGIVALDPHTGRVLAMSGGFSFQQSQFNRVTQAKRQPGSAFKPFVYLAALDSGFTPSTLILDAPFVIDQGPGLPKWRPANYTNEFYGPSTMRLGIEKSRNLMTVRLAENVGMERISEYAERFGIIKGLPEQLSMALGAGETTLLDLTSAYAMLVNGGKEIKPTFIDRIQDRNGHTVYRHDQRPCAGCAAVAWTDDLMVPEIPDLRQQLTDPASAYQMVSMLEGVVQRGTGASIRVVGKPLAGKTGTTNDSQDAWFIGFSPDLAVGVFIGFDEPRSLGDKEQGASVAAPVFRDFMKDALENQPPVPFRIPPGIHLVRINAATGLPAVAGDKDVILEAFKPGTVPTAQSRVLGGGQDGEAGNGDGESPATGTGGLY
ncbi:MAG: penicillin-binding protein 1A [Rhodospirillales bacterium]|nr:penicillin-binding protein 1A [Rhodospirillales bacterium]